MNVRFNARLVMYLPNKLIYVYSERSFEVLENCLPIAFSLLLVLIATVPVVVFLDGVIARSIIALLAALALFLVAVSARAADVIFFNQVTRHLKLATAIPAAWMAVQILPTPFAPHSIWTNANMALQMQAWGHVSIDLGTTLESLAFYLANIAVIMVSIFVSKDRRRAEFMLFTIVAVASLTTIALLISKTPLISGATDTNGILMAISAAGLLASLATAVLAFERYTSQRDEKGHDTSTVIALSGAGLIVALVGVGVAASLNTALVVVFATITFGSIQAVRRLGLASWTAGIFVATMMLAAIMIIAWRYEHLAPISPFLQFATSASSDAISVTQRILSDTSWLGNGAGTYANVLPIYREFASQVSSAPSTVSALATGLGAPMTLVIVAMAIGLFVVLYRGALRRGRDSFFPAAAAATIIILLGEAFCDASLLNSGVAVIGDTLIGLGLAQSISRRDGP